jgi:hypothetical protein
MALVCKAVDDITSHFFKLYGENKYELSVSSNITTQNFAGFVTNGLGPNDAREPPVGSRCIF